MPLSEFELIERFFAAATAARDDVLLGVGDDCALLQVPDGQTLAASVDTLVEGRHFLVGADPESLGHKALAVNLSDLASMGAIPAWATLALTLPRADSTWLQAFMHGFSSLAAEHRMQLVGGDTTRGPLSITIQVHGFVPRGQGLRRSGARSDDRLFVSGTLGDAALALRQRSGAGAVDEALARRMDRPTPRIALGRLLLDYASAAIDVSDGLLGDLGHICAASGVGAQIELAKLPLTGPVAEAADWRLSLAGGDDYELLFAVPPSRVDGLCRAAAAAGHRIQEVGRLVDKPEITLVYPDGSMSKEMPDGFDHFRE